MTQEKFAIVGLGNIGQVVANNLAKGGRPIIVADRNPPKAKALAAKLGNLAQPMEVVAAIKAADIILFAVGFETIKQLMTQYPLELSGKIVVDPSNPIAPDGKGGFVKTIGEKESAGQQISALLPAGSKLVKAFGTLSAASLANAAFQKPSQSVLFYAAEDSEIRPAIEALIHDSGFDPLLAGGIDQSIRLEVFGDLHEFGAIGKTVTLAEAKEKL